MIPNLYLCNFLFATDANFDRLLALSLYMLFKWFNLNLLSTVLEAWNFPRGAFSLQMSDYLLILDNIWARTFLALELNLTFQHHFEHEIHISKFDSPRLATWSGTLPRRSRGRYLEVIGTGLTCTTVACFAFLWLIHNDIFAEHTFVKVFALLSLGLICQQIER